MNAETEVRCRARSDASPGARSGGDCLGPPQKEQAVLCRRSIDGSRGGATDALYAPILDAPTEGRYADFIGLIREEAPFLATDANLYWWRGNAYYFLGQYDKALADYQRVTQLVPRFAGVDRIRASVFSQVDRHEEALVDARHAALLEPYNADYQSLLG